MVAFGGSLAKRSIADVPLLDEVRREDMSCLRTGRSAKTMEFDDTPVSVNLLPGRSAFRIQHGKRWNYRIRCWTDVLLRGVTDSIFSNCRMRCAKQTG